MSEQLDVHVEGIPFSWDEESLKSFFEKCGDIKSVRMPTWHDSGRSKGYGFITFANASSATAAVELDKAEVEGRWLKVSYATGNTDSGASKSGGRFSCFSSTPEDDCKSLFIKNLPYEVTEDEIGDMFKVFGKISSVRVPTDQGRVKGFCFIEFEEADAVLKIKAAFDEGTRWSLGGRDLIVDYGKGQPRAGFHARPESYNSRFSGTPVRRGGYGGIDKRGSFGGKGKGKGKGKGFRRD